MSVHRPPRPLAVDRPALPAAGRPDECECDELPPGELPCWPCYRDGFAMARGERR